MGRLIDHEYSRAPGRQVLDQDFHETPCPFEIGCRLSCERTFSKPAEELYIRIRRGGCHNGDRDTPERQIRLDFLKGCAAVLHGKVEIKENQVRSPFVPVLPAKKEEIHKLRPILDPLEDAPEADLFQGTLGDHMVFHVTIRHEDYAVADIGFRSDGSLLELLRCKKDTQIMGRVLSRLGIQQLPCQTQIACNQL